MQRAMVFLLYGPASAAFITCLALQETLAPFAAFVAILAFFWILAISVLAGILDACLAPFVPIRLRAPLTAVAGTILLDCLAVSLAGPVPSQALRFWSFSCAIYLGTCSLLANDRTSR
jgi:hypothetical protein